MYNIKQIQELLPNEVAFLPVTTESLPTWLVWNYSGFAARVTQHGNDTFEYVFRVTT